MQDKEKKTNPSQTSGESRSGSRPPNKRRRQQRTPRPRLEGQTAKPRAQEGKSRSATEKDPQEAKTRSASPKTAQEAKVRPASQKSAPEARARTTPAQEGAPAAPRRKKRRQPRDQRWSRETIRAEETYEDILRDNARLERDIQLDIESLQQISLDLG